MGNVEGLVKTYVGTIVDNEEDTRSGTRPAAHRENAGRNPGGNACRIGCGIACENACRISCLVYLRALGTCVIFLRRNPSRSNNYCAISRVGSTLFLTYMRTWVYFVHFVPVSARACLLVDTETMICGTQCFGWYCVAERLRFVLLILVHM